MLIEALGLEQARLVALCGAGGKTTLMLALACELAARGERVLASTTTKMARDEGRAGWPSGVCFSHAGQSGTKLIGHRPGFIDELKQGGAFDRLLVEADGSKRRSLKAPAAHEPVIPSASDAVVVVAGLSALGLPLSEETVFRAQTWAALTGLALGAPVTPESLARIAVHPAGLAKGCPDGAQATLFLNQAHTSQARAAAAVIVRLIAATGANRFARIVIGSLKPSPHIVESFPCPRSLPSTASCRSSIRAPSCIPPRS